MDRTRLWEPSAQRWENAQIREYMTWLRTTYGVAIESYSDLHRWSIENIDDFWESMWSYFSIVGERGTGPVREGASLSSTRWFSGARLNYAENLLRQADATPDSEAVVGLHESGPRESLSWAQLRAQVASLSRHLRSLGVGPGDTVCAVLPSLVQTPVALLAAASVGAVWSVVSTDFGVDGIADRFAQIAPTVLFTVDRHEFDGQVRDQLPQLPAILDALPTVRHHVLIDTAPASLDDPGSAATETPATGATDATGSNGAGATLRVPSVAFSEIVAEPAAPEYDRVEFSHPLWVLYSSGTTGRPKGIVHSHGGIVLEATKANALQYDVRPGDRVHFAVSTTWVVWNLMVDAMMRGATMITYDGSPTWQRPDRHLVICSQERATLFCTGAAVLTLGARSGARPKDEFDFTHLRTIISTGSPLPTQTWTWALESVKADMLVGSDSGGTDIASGILGSNPLDPVWLGELQGPYLGVDARTVDDTGESIEGEVGELVMAAPLPSMPVGFWNDPDGEKYRAAYFEDFAGLWRQGDWATKVPGGGYIIHGRSDATINRGGIRMGSADICTVVDQVPGVRESMVIGAELEGGDYFMPLFVVLAAGQDLDEELEAAITEAIRSRISPRYVPDEIIAAPGIPRTRTGKIMEVPIKRVFQGGDPTAVNRTTATEPGIVDWFLDLAASFAGDRAAGRTAALPRVEDETG